MWRVLSSQTCKRTVGAFQHKLKMYSSITIKHSHKPQKTKNKSCWEHTQLSQLQWNAWLVCSSHAATPRWASYLSGFSLYFAKAPSGACSQGRWFPNGSCSKSSFKTALGLRPLWYGYFGEGFTACLRAPDGLMNLSFDGYKLPYGCTTSVRTLVCANFCKSSCGCPLHRCPKMAPPGCWLEFRNPPVRTTHEIARAAVTKTKTLPCTPATP
jgi:hypothetical protein